MESAASQSQPNPIGLPLLALERIEGRLLYVSVIDVMDGTPVLDIKPYAPAFERAGNVRFGRLEGIADQVRGRTADDRFSSA